MYPLYLNLIGSVSWQLIFLRNQRPGSIRPLHCELNEDLATNRALICAAALFSLTKPLVPGEIMDSQRAGMHSHSKIMRGVTPKTQGTPPRSAFSSSGG